MKTDISNTILISDLDGTLLPRDGVVCKEDIAAIREYMALGGHFALATGRMPDMLDLAYEFGTNIPSIIGNGTVVYDMNTKKVLWERFLNPTVRVMLPDVMRAFETVCAEVRILDKLYIVRPNATFDWHNGWEKHKYTLVNDIENIYNCHKVLLLEEHGLLLQARDYIQSRYPDTFDFTFSCDVFLEIVPKGCTKGDTVAHLRELCGMPNHVLFAMGDYGNDVTMLKAADFSGCPENAIPIVRQTADMICAPVGKGAMSEFITRIRRDFIV